MDETTCLSVEHEGHQWWFSLGQAMWKFHGPDGQELDVRPVISGEPAEITVRRLKDWLARWIYEDARRVVQLDGVEWLVRREPGISVMGQSRGERTALPPPPGLYFIAPDGDTLFVAEEMTGLRFVTLSVRDLVRRLAAAQRDRAWQSGPPRAG
jgi:hypothetical protein